jgi:putative oxidoreductase
MAANQHTSPKGMTHMSSLINKVLFTRAGYGLTILRIAVGVIFAAHGSQKLFGLFGGYGLAGTAQYMDSLGLHPGYLMATLAGGTEFFAGLALIIGLLVRPAALGLTFLSLVAIFTVHISNGLFMANNGYEFALALLGGSLAVMIEGAGKLSVDRAIAG